MEDNSFNDLMNKNIIDLLRTALCISLKNFSQALFVLNTISSQKRAARLRLKNEELGVHVPPFMIISITNRCNLACKGCYAQARHKKENSEMSAARLKNIIGEGRELGISIVLLAGGEPLMRKNEILELGRNFPDIIFPLFTNGMLLSDDLMDILKYRKNVIPVVSIEGYEEDTNGRRGIGVFEYLKGVFKRMNDRGMFYGTSITMTRTNFDKVTDESFAKGLIKGGCKLFFFVEYVPVKEGTEEWVLTENQKKSVAGLMDTLRKRLSGIFIAFPGDEEAFGGCLAAGRGFVHISSEGNLEPCPFAPFSDTDLNEKSLKEALNSDFLKTIRQNHNLLNEGQTGCALWENRDYIQTLIDTKR